MLRTAIPSTFVPSFRIFDKNKQRISSLSHCFLKEMHFTKEDYINLTKITLRSGPNLVSYQVIWDDSVFPDLIERVQGLDCIISFQKHTFGSFAIVKKAKS